VLVTQSRSTGSRALRAQLELICIALALLKDQRILLLGSEQEAYAGSAALKQPVISEDHPHPEGAMNTSRVFEIAVTNSNLNHRQTPRTIELPTLGSASFRVKA